MSKIAKSLVLALLLVLVSSFSFLAGYGAGQRPLVAAVTEAESTPTAGLPERFGLFWEAWGLVDREYFGRSGIDLTAVTYGAIRGMMQSLNDPHSYFVDPQERSVTEAQLQGGFEGIGVYIELTPEGRLRVVGTQEGSPGAKADLRAGDLITHVDGKPIEGLTLVQAVSLIRGPRGTKVILGLRRDGSPEPLTVEMVRADIKVESVRSRMLDGNVAYLKISQFGLQTSTELRTALYSLLSQSPRGLVLDLRSNPGGYLATAIDVASQFLSEGVVLYEERSGGERQEYPVKPGGAATGIPMVVLVNKGSASAAEIVAGALQDYQRAPLVGEKTFGKGSMQSVHTLSDGSSLHVTIAHWLTPKQRPINGNGLLPDLPVERPADASPDSDPQLDQAVKLLLERS